jgi:hypothetical protein
MAATGTGRDPQRSREKQKAESGKRKPEELKVEAPSCDMLKR